MITSNNYDSEKRTFYLSIVQGLIKRWVLSYRPVKLKKTMGVC